ncbi:MAG: hypothetical protein DSY55_02170 [Clostridia bacterium]|nr:MAG: hypothetical protein DSY55_02170 [Clostridia bacterium]
MTHFNEIFVDVDAYQPPSKWEERFNNLQVWLIVALLLVGGWFFKDWMMNQFRFLALAEGQPVIPYPLQWQQQPAEAVTLQVVDPASKSPFHARETVILKNASKGDFTTVWPEQRTLQLRDYKEVERRLVKLGDDRQALWLLYTYVSDMGKSQAANASPGVIQAQDVVFETTNELGQKQWVVITLAADSNEWDQEWPTFRRILEKLGVPVL